MKWSRDVDSEFNRTNVENMTNLYGENDVTPIKSESCKAKVEVNQLTEIMCENGSKKTLRSQ